MFCYCISTVDYTFYPAPHKRDMCFVAGLGTWARAGPFCRAGARASMFPLAGGWVSRKAGMVWPQTSTQAEQHPSAHLTCKACVKWSSVGSDVSLRWPEPVFHELGDSGAIRPAPTPLPLPCVSRKPLNPQKPFKIQLRWLFQRRTSACAGMYSADAGTEMSQACL